MPGTTQGLSRMGSTLQMLRRGPEFRDAGLGLQAFRGLGFRVKGFGLRG